MIIFLNSSLVSISVDGVIASVAYKLSVMIIG